MSGCGRLPREALSEVLLTLAGRPGPVLGPGVAGRVDVTQVERLLHGGDLVVGVRHPQDRQVLREVVVVCLQCVGLGRARGLFDELVGLGVGVLAEVDGGVRGEEALAGGGDREAPRGLGSED